MSSNQSTIWKNSIFIFFSQAIRLITNFVVFILIARFYGPESLGQFSLAFTIANISLVLADFGFDVLLTYEIAKDSGKTVTTVRKYFSLKLIFVLLASIVLIMIPTYGSFSENTSSFIYSLVFYVIFSSIANFFFAIFRGLEKFEFETKISFISNLGLLICLFIIGIFESSLSYFVFIFIFARLIALILSVIKVIPILGIGIFKLDFSEWKIAINQVLVFGLHFLFGNLFFKLDTILLGIWKGDEEVGIYQSAFRIMLFILIIPDILRNAILPIVSRLYEYEKDKWILLNKLITKFSLLIALPLSLILFFFPEQIIYIVYGNNSFNGAITLLKIFSLVILVRFYVEPYALMITSARKQHLRLVIVIFSTVVAVLLNYFMIPSWGIVGAAYASLCVNIIAGLGYILVNWKYFICWINDFRTLSLLTVTFLLSSVITYLDLQIISAVILTITITLLIFVFGLSMKEKKTLFNIVFRKF